MNKKNQKSSLKRSKWRSRPLKKKQKSNHRNQRQNRSQKQNRNRNRKDNSNRMGMGMKIKTNKWMRRQRKRKTFYPVRPIKHQTKMMVPEHFTVVFIRKILIQNLPKSIACSMGCLIRIKLWRLWRNWGRKKNDFYTNIQITENIKECVFLLI